MSSDTSPPSGYRLESPAATNGGPAGGAPRRQQPSDPSWITVIGTTVRLWLRRRVLHVPDSGRVGTVRVRRLAGVAAVVVVVAGAGIAAGLTLTAQPAPAPRHARAPARPRLTPQQIAALQAGQAAAQANANAAAAWITAQVGAGTIIGCDPATCAAILQTGFAMTGEVVLQPGVSLPAPGSLIVATGTVRGQYRATLADSAPELIAVFGTGAQSVQLRVAVAGGAQAYSQAASAALTARRGAGRALLAAGVHATGATRTAILSGRLDPRLTTVLRQLGARYPVYLDRVGDAGPSPAVSVPYRMAQVVVVKTRVRHRRVSELPGLERLLTGEPAADRAALSTLQLPGGKRVLQIVFAAPSPQ